jgi:hypothetical protein
MQKGLRVIGGFFLLLDKIAEGKDPSISDFIPKQKPLKTGIFKGLILL